MPKQKLRSASEIQSELDQHNRNVSWTLGRSSVEGTSLSRELTESMLATSRRLEEELRLAQAKEKKKIS